MAKEVSVTYVVRDKFGEAQGMRTETNLLVTVDDAVTTTDGEVSVPLDMLAQPGRYLLEDDFGLWYLKYEDCIEMKEIK